MREQENNTGVTRDRQNLGQCIASNRSLYTAGKFSVQCVGDGTNEDDLMDDSGMVVRAV